MLNIIKNKITSFWNERDAFGKVLIVLLILLKPFHAILFLLGYVAPWIWQEISSSRHLSLEERIARNLKRAKEEQERIDKIAVPKILKKVSQEILEAAKKNKKEITICAHDIDLRNWFAKNILLEDPIYPAREQFRLIIESFQEQNPSLRVRIWSDASGARISWGN